MKSKRFFDTKPYAIVCEEEPQGADKRIRYKFVVHREVPAGLRIPIVGCLGELRATLDNLVWSLSQVCGERQSCGIKFPVYLSEHPPTTAPKTRAFDTWVRDNNPVLSKFPTGAVDLIRSLQPFNPYKGTQVGASHPVYILNRLANQDKHKMPLHIAGVHGYKLSLGSITLKGPGRIGPPTPLQNGSIFLEGTVAATEPVKNLEIKVITCIAFDDNGPAPNVAVYKFIVDTYYFVRDEVIAKFEPFFPK